MKHLTLQRHLLAIQVPTPEAAVRAENELLQVNVAGDRSTSSNDLLYRFIVALCYGNSL